MVHGTNPDLDAFWVRLNWDVCLQVTCLESGSAKQTAALSSLPTTGYVTGPLPAFTGSWCHRHCSRQRSSAFPCPTSTCHPKAFLQTSAALPPVPERHLVPPNFSLMA
ncbi:uncharacterized protein ACIB01_011698 [Guaruba guarouba]